ncbi:hypothetical protein B0H16DRAFT_1894946 [Mycena metata]|uniref:F-box domain-containing protein n=1 Tax=Mycena metata TaxID=1033252 RepID=A0AAD7HQE6_9AGAR|nr:hypothetical protein B0H16DRAFT_1894946 [Mycena metata]
MAAEDQVKIQQLRSVAFYGNGIAISVLTSWQNAPPLFPTHNKPRKLSMLPTFIEGLNGQIFPLEIENASQPRAAAHPIQTLPPEILAKVFVHFLPAYPEFPPLSGPLSPLLLCQICQEWRAIALSTPSLWSAIRITSPTDVYVPESHEVPKLEILKTWLTHFLDAIASHCGRWEHLDVLIAPQDIKFMQGEMPLLRELRIGPNAFAQGVGESSTLFAHAPLLRTVVLSDIFLLDRMYLPWAQLTHLYAGCLYEWECLDLLHQTTHLVSFTANILQHGGGYFGKNHTVLHLRDLILHPVSSFEEGWRWGILDWQTLPALRKLQISEQHTPLASLQAFISRSQCTLEELRVTHATLEESVFREALPVLGKIILEAKTTE